MAVRLPVDTAVPVVTAPTLLLTEPVPPVKTAVKVVAVPEVTGLLAATKLVMTGAGTAVTVSVAALLLSVPVALVKTQRYWVPLLLTEVAAVV